jgi:NADH dehydrogenase
MIVVAGGTGRLGSLVVRGLVDAGERVRVVTRDRTRAARLPPDVDVVVADLRLGARGLDDALRGARRVISCVHGFAGPGRPSPDAIDRAGNCALVDAARAAGVEKIVLVSVYAARADHPMPLMRAKAQAELAVRASGVPFAIVRPTAFLETWIEIVGRGLVFGPGENPINFVSVRDVAAVVTRCTLNDDKDEVVDVGGPESFGFRELAQRLKPAHIISIPLSALRLLSVVARPFSPAFARQAHAAVVMNTTDLRYRGAFVGSARFDDVVAGLLSPDDAGRPALAQP